MLERMRDFSKSWIMKGLLGLVALSFVAYFGNAPFQKAKKEKLNSAVIVNGQAISAEEFRLAYDRLRIRMRERQGWDLDEEQQRQVAQTVFDGLIDMALQEQWFREKGLAIPDEDVANEISRILNQYGQGRPITRALYYSFLTRNEYRSQAAFEQDLRRQLVLDRLSQIQMQSVKVSDREIREAYAQKHRQVKVTAVGFRWEDYVNTMSPSPIKIEKYYDAHQSDYRQPDRINVDYIEVLPETLREEVTFIEGRLEEFFNQNRDNYQIGAQFAVDYVLFPPEQFREQVILSEEDLQQSFQENAEKYKKPQRIKVRYIPVPIYASQGVNAPTDRSLRRTYSQNQDKYVQTETSQIFLRVPSNASNLEESRIHERADQIREQVLNGMDFSDAARQYSEDATAPRGGNLGFVDRGQLPSALDKALFKMKIGDISEPIRGPSGYHILKVHGKHAPTLEEVQDKIVRLYAENRLEEIRDNFQGSALPENNIGGLEVFETDFFERNKYIDDRIGSDFGVFGSRAFRMKDQEMSRVIYGTRNYYLIYRMATEPARPMSFEEAQSEIRKQLQIEGSNDVALNKAEEVLEQLKNEETDFETLTETEGIKVRDSGFFSMENPPQGLGPNPYVFIATASNLEPGQYSGVITLDNGYAILRGKEGQEARLPELEEVRAKVEADYRALRSVDLAKDHAYEYFRQVDDQRLSLRKLSMVAGVEVKNSGLFGEAEPIPGLVDPNNLFHHKAFSMETIGEVLPDVTEVYEPSSREVRAYYLMELKDRVPSHIAPIDDVMDQVRQDYLQFNSIILARRDAEEFLGKMEAAIASVTDEPFSLKKFAESLNLKPFDTPFFGQMGYIPRIAGTEDSPEFTRCALGLEPGQCSGILEVKQKMESSGTDEEAELQTTGYFMIQVLENKEPDFTDYEEQKESLKNQILYSRGRQSAVSWLEELRARAKIEKNKDLMASFRIDQEAEEETASQESDTLEEESPKEESDSSSS